MKKFTTVLLLIALMIPAAALAYDNGSVRMSFDPRIASGRLNQEMYTRTGPGTEYTTFGSIGYEGQWVDVYSITYDRNGVCWAQVAAEVDGMPVRVYTGLKRIDGVDLDYVSRDSNYNEVVHTYCDARPRTGPGYHYASYNFILPEYTEVRIIQIERDENSDEYFTACDFYYNGSFRRGWFPSHVIP